MRNVIIDLQKSVTSKLKLTIVDEEGVKHSKNSNTEIMAYAIDVVVKLFVSSLLRYLDWFRNINDRKWFYVIMFLLVCSVFIIC